MHYDLPKEQILPEIESKVAEQLKEVSEHMGIAMEMERLEWLITGIRIHMKS